MALTKVTYGLLSADTSAIDLNIDANTLYVDSSANRVGIGTSSPAYFLHVKHANNTETVTESVGDYFPSTSIKRTGGSSKTNYYWEFQIGSSGNLNFKDRTNSYYPIILNASGDVLLGNNTSGANPTMFIDQSTGRVGIGTSSPGVHLDIESSTNNAQIEITATDGTDQSYGIFGATGNNSNGAGFYIQDKTASGSPIRFKIDTSGNVGIGTTSPSSAKLVVSGAKTQSGGAPIGNILIADSTALAANVGGGITFQGVYHTGGNLTGLASIEAMKETATHNEYGGALVLKAREDQGAMNEVVRFTSTGNLQFSKKGTNFVTPGFTYHTNNYLYLRGGSSGLILTDDSGINTVQIIDGSNGYINIETGDGSSRMRITSTGKVGIGTTNPNGNFHVGSSNATGDATNPAIQIGGTNSYRLGLYTDSEAAYIENKNGDNGLVFRVKTAGEAMRIAGGTGTIFLGSNKYGYFRGGVENSFSSGWNANSDTYSTWINFEGYQGGTTKFRDLSIGNGKQVAIVKFDGSSGNVGIGELNPDAPLHITSNTPIIAYDESDTSQEFRLGVFGGAFALYDSNDTAFRMLVDGDGRVGIGTSAPTGQRLCIGGHSTSDTMTEANAWFVAEATGGDGIAIGSIASSPYTTWIQSGYLNTMGTSNHYPISLNPHDGLVLINTSTNAGLSNNVGGARYGHSFGGGQQVNSTNNDTNLILNMSNGYSNALVLFRYNGSTKGTISTNGSAVAYNTSSDYRLKQNEIAVWDGTTVLKQLKPYKFNWKADPTGEAVQGFFAHEVAEVIPEVVSGEKDGEEMQGIDHSKLVPLLVKTIQELEARITELESK